MSERHAAEYTPPPSEAIKQGDLDAASVSLVCSLVLLRHAVPMTAVKEKLERGEPFERLLTHCLAPPRAVLVFLAAH